MNDWGFCPKSFYLAHGSMGLGSGIRDPGSGKNLFRIQGSKRHRIPDQHPQHCKCTLILIRDFMSLLESELTMLFYRKTVTPAWNPVLRIRDVYPRSRIRICPSRIPDPGSKRFRIPDPHQRIFFFFFNPKNCFQSLGQIIWDVLYGSGFFYIQDSGSGAFLSEICGGK